MWERKKVKQNGKNYFFKNYWPCVVICFLLAFLGCEYSSSSAVFHSYNNNKSAPENVIYTTEHLTNTNVLGGEDSLVSNAFESVSHISSYVFKFLGSVKEAISTEYFAAIMLGLAFIVQLMYVLFICNPIIVGSKKFFIDNRNQNKTQIRTVLDPYRKGNLLNIVKVMFMQSLYLILWFFTIIGFFIKAYEYRMIPYILAENPNLKSKDVFKQTKELMRGNKWKVFVFDLSYIGWFLLNALTLGLTGILYSNPYKSAATTEIYFKLKENKSNYDVNPV